MTAPPILLDEHVGRLFERLLRERGYTVEQAIWIWAPIITERCPRCESAESYHEQSDVTAFPRGGPSS